MTDSRFSRILTHRATVGAWIAAEVALARAHERAGLIPQGVADRIALAADLASIDLARLVRDTELVGFPIAPLVKQIVEHCDDEAAKWVHWGSTTQDIVDTGLMLQAREAIDEIERELCRLIDALRQLTIAHRGTVMVGRTFQQHAAPITFGFKTAVWLDELLRHSERLSEMRSRVLVGQCGGAVGTLASLDANGVEIRRRMMADIGLGVPDMTWHTARDRWAEIVSWLAMLGATLGKMSTEVVLLMRTEVNEIREPPKPGRGISSAMPQKRNPTVAPRVIAIAHRLREFASSQLTAMIQDHERGAGSMPLEWMVIPEALSLTHEAVSRSADVMEGLEVDVERMRRNLESDGGLLMAEAVMMGLAEKIGRELAMGIVSRTSRSVAEEGGTLKDALLADAAVTDVLSLTDIERLLEPDNYLGSAGAMIDAVLARSAMTRREVL